MGLNATILFFSIKKGARIKLPLKKVQESNNPIDEMIWEIIYIYTYKS